MTTERLPNRIWHRDILAGHIGWGFTGWAYARLVAVDIDRDRLRFEVIGHYVGLYR